MRGGLHTSSPTALQFQPCTSTTACCKYLFKMDRERLCRQHQRSHIHTHTPTSTGTKVFPIKRYECREVDHKRSREEVAGMRVGKLPQAFFYNSLIGIQMGIAILARCFFLRVCCGWLIITGCVTAFAKCFVFILRQYEI